MLPGGGSIWLTVRPTLASAQEFDRLVETMHRADIQHARSLDSNAASARKIARRVMQGAIRVRRSRHSEYRKLRRQILNGDAKVERRIDDLSTRVARESQAERKTLSRLLRSCGRRDLLNHLVLVSAAVLMAAYGQRNDPLAENNLVIAISLVVWLVGDGVSDVLSGKRSMNSGPIRGSDIWSYTAPFANLLTGWWLLNEQQHHRFITGTTQGKVVLPGGEGVFTAEVMDLSGTLPSNAANSESRNPDGNHRAIGQRDTYTAKVDLSPRIAPEHLSDFRSFNNVSVVATIQSFKGPDPQHTPTIELLSAEITDGFWLSITVEVSSTRCGTPTDRGDVTPILKRLAVSWAVDTQEASV